MKRLPKWLAALAMAGALSLDAQSAEPKSGPPAARSRQVEIRCESTSSRIRRNRIEDCAKAMQPTTNYYLRELETTGEADLGKSLRQLDPRFQ